MTSFTVVLDACVLYPASLRDLLMWLAVTGLYRARWTETIVNEWSRNLLANRPDLTAQALARTHRLMNEAVLDAVVTGHESLIPGLQLPDPDDRHVLAAAIRCGAAVIVTYNTKDFPSSVLAGYGIEALHPDDFLLYQIDLAPGAVAAAVKRHRASLRNPPRSVDEYLDTLECQQLPKTAYSLRDFADVI